MQNPARRDVGRDQCEPRCRQGAQTLAHFLDQWLETVARARLRPRSFERYEGIVRLYLVPDLGSVKLARLRAQHIADLYASLLQPRRVHDPACAIGSHRGAVHGRSVEPSIS